MKSHLSPIVLRWKSLGSSMRFSSIPTLAVVRGFACCLAFVGLVSCATDDSLATSVKRASAAGRRDARERTKPEAIALRKVRVQNWPKLAKGMTREEVARLLPILHPPTSTKYDGGKLDEIYAGIGCIYQYNPTNSRYELASWTCFSKRSYPELFDSNGNSRGGMLSLTAQTDGHGNVIPGTLRERKIKSMEYEVHNGLVTKFRLKAE